METSTNTKVCSCCGREYELKYFHRSYTICKLCISKIKHDKYEQKKLKKQGNTPRLLLLETRLAAIERKMKKDAEKLDFDAYMQDQRDYAQCQQAITFATQPKKRCDVVEYFTPIKTK